MSRKLVVLGRVCGLVALALGRSFASGSTNTADHPQTSSPQAP